jgi:sugar (pentulose or hexulose) kinase
MAPRQRRGSGTWDVSEKRQDCGAFHEHIQQPADPRGLTASLRFDQIWSKENKGRRLRLGCVVVLDVGKSLTKLTLWSPDGRLLERHARPNTPQRASAGYRALDVEGIEDWTARRLAELATRHDIAAIVPVAHGAAAAIVNDDGTYLPPIDYETELPRDIRDQYVALRDPFAVTGSPCLPAGLNLGAQLYWLDTLEPKRAGRIVTWPQFWSWRLSGVASTEISSFGTHTDLWCPATASPSPLAMRHGWAERLAPLRHASTVLGPVTPQWRERCGLPAGCAVLCGVHDSNAALLAARLYPQTGTRAFTVLSTGTWFITMRASDGPPELSTLCETRDCLVNVDVDGRPVPSSRFMGGREAEAIEDAPHDDGQTAPEAGHATRLIERGIVALPSFQPGVGPFPDAAGRWSARPDDPRDRRAAASLYLALMSDVSLDLIGSREQLIVEGRFAADPLFLGALAALRPQQQVYIADMPDNVPLGALYLFNCSLRPEATLKAVAPLPIDLADYARRWRHEAESSRRMTPA